MAAAVGTRPADRDRVNALVSAGRVANQWGGCPRKLGSMVIYLYILYIYSKWVISYKL